MGCAATERVGEALEAQNPPKIRRRFASFRGRADRRLYDLDTELKRLCDEPRTVGEPLAAVLRMLA